MNYPTELVDLWIDNDEGLYNLVNEVIRDNRSDTVSELADIVESTLDEISDRPQSGLAADLFQSAWSQVDWREIVSSRISEDDEEDEQDNA